jgi:hypothetical protein
MNKYAASLALAVAVLAFPASANATSPANHNCMMTTTMNPGDAIIANGPPHGGGTTHLSTWTYHSQPWLWQVGQWYYAFGVQGSINSYLNPATRGNPNPGALAGCWNKNVSAGQQNATGWFNH